jgi:hypothetical protein
VHVGVKDLWVLCKFEFFYVHVVLGQDLHLGLMGFGILFIYFWINCGWNFRPLRRLRRPTMLGALHQLRIRVRARNPGLDLKTWSCNPLIR